MRHDSPKWSNDVVAHLKRLWAEGISASEIAKRLSVNVSRNAVIGKAFRLGLPRQKKIDQPTTEGALNREKHEVIVPARRSIRGRREIIFMPETDPRRKAQQSRHAQSLLAAEKKAQQLSLLKKEQGAKNRPDGKSASCPRYIVKHDTRVDRPASTGNQKMGIVAPSVNYVSLGLSEELRRDWIYAAEYLSKFAHLHPEAEDIIRVRSRLADIEQRWMSLREQSNDKAFVWPSTEAHPGAKSFLVGDWPEIGMLRHLGYNVRQEECLSDPARQQLLTLIFESNLPPVNSISYMREWGSARSSLRLQKMAESIASFVRMQKRKGKRQSGAAILRWQSDLIFLKRNYYDGKFNWPSR